MAFSQGRKLLDALSKAKNLPDHNIKKTTELHLLRPKTSVKPASKSSRTRTRRSSQIIRQRDKQEEAGSEVSGFTPDELVLLNPEWVTTNVVKQSTSAAGADHANLVDYSVASSSSSAKFSHSQTAFDSAVQISQESISKVKQWLFRGDNDVIEVNTKTTTPQHVTPDPHVTPELVTGHFAEKVQTLDIIVTPEEAVEKKSQPGNKVKKALFYSDSVPDGKHNFTLTKIRSTNSPEVHALDDDILAGIDPLDGILVLPLEPLENEVVIETISVHGDIDATNLDVHLLQLNEPENEVVIENAETLQVESETTPDSNQDENGNIIKKRKRQSLPADKTPPKKRKVVQARWKASMAKEAYNSGIAHVTLRGKERAARTMKPGCTASCRKGCKDKITEQVRQEQFHKYWDSKNKPAQWLMLAKLVTVVPVKRRRVTLDDETDEPFRKHSYEYHLPDETSKNISVCQTMFLHTFDISIKCVKSALTKNSPDKRGKHDNRRRLSQELIDSVKIHIKRFPVVESHYCRVDTRKKYLDEGLSVARMHRLYLLVHDKSDCNTASLRQYRDIFSSFFNLGFFKPKKDQCFVCAEWKAFTEEEKSAHPEKSAEIADHIKNKQIVRKMKRHDKAESRDKEKNPDLSKIRVITFDLQKVFLTPRSDVGEFFYKRKLSSYNFTVFDCTVKEAHCYCWDQTIGDRGANEMASYIYDYILFLVSKGVTEILIYSDSCSAQNKNQFLYSMYYWITIKHKIKIVHRYLEKGHTQMEADNVHARIEKKIKHEDIYLPQQWYSFIRSARVKKPHYIVKEVNQNDILDMKYLGHYFQWSKLPISKIREIVFDCNSSPDDIVSFKKNLESESSVINVLAKKPGRPVNWATIRPPKPVYTAKRPMKTKLKEDLEWFLKKNYIPAPYVDKFRALLEYEAQDGVPQDDEENDTPEEIITDEANAIHLYEEDENNDVPEDAEVTGEDDQPGSATADDDNVSTDSEAYD